MADGMNKPAIRFAGFTDAWEQRKLNEVVNVYDGVHQTPDYKDSGVMFLSVENISTLKSEKYISEEAFQRDYKVYPQKGDILMTRIGDVGTPNVVETTEKVAFYVSLALLKTTKINSYFLCNSIQSPLFQKGLKDRTLVTAIPQKINKDEIGKVNIILPTSSQEQQLIGEYFRNLDHLITLHQRKYAKLVNIKASMLEKMFPKDGSAYPEVRFAGFTDAWEQRKAKGLFNSTADKGYPELPVLSATQDRGMIRRDENSINIFHDKKNESGYKRVLPGQFVIHLRSFQGGFAHSTIEGITSPAYTVFGFSEPEKHDSEYWKYVFTSKEFIRRLETVTYGIRDGRSISYDEFLTLDFVYPSKAEQTAIARYLDELSDLITLHQRKLEKLQNIKKSMLEKMFV